MHRLTIERLERITPKARVLGEASKWKELKDLYAMSCKEEGINDAGLGYLSTWCFLVGLSEEAYFRFRDNTEVFPLNVKL